MGRRARNTLLLSELCKLFSSVEETTSRGFKILNLTQIQILDLDFCSGPSRVLDHVSGAGDFTDAVHLNYLYCHIIY